jgi:hypothetical protein
VTDPEILAVARSTRYDVGGNRKGATTGATWTLLLPRLPIGRIALLGVAEPAARERLDELVDEAVDGLPAEGRFDVIWLPPSGGRRPADRAALRGRLSDDGVVVDEAPGGLAAEDAATARFSVLRQGGDTLVATPLAHPVVDSWLRRHGLAGSSGSRLRDRLRRLTSGFVRGRSPVRSSAWGFLDMVGQPGLDRPPRYLRDLAATGGYDIAAFAWGLSATGPYRTQKALLPLFAAGASAPEMIVKVARHSSVNPRLHVELDALRRLATLGPTIAERVPAVLFAGRHAGLLVVGESALDGDPFRAARKEGDLRATDAVAWLTELGQRTASPVDAREVAGALDELVDTYVAADGPGRTLDAQLRAQVERIRGHPDPFPVVAQHGDPGTWNLIALPGDRTGFLDWENFEERGMPLWDVVYLLRSLAVGSLPRRRLERRLEHVQRTFLDTSAFTPFIVGAVRRYCAQVGLADDLVEPLYHLGWMYQALKEVTRLAPGSLGEGHFYALLRRGLEGRSNGTLDTLFRGTRT